MNISMFSFIAFFFSLLSCLGCNEKKDILKSAIIGQGKIPQLVRDSNNYLHIVYGKGDSIMYSNSKDDGRSFSSPSLVAIHPKLFSTAMRGPQIAQTNNGLAILGADESGDIYSYIKDESGWKQASKVNDTAQVAKEGLMAVSGDGETLFAVWLDLRGNNRNKIVGSKSIDGGKSWSKNIQLYVSPDSTVCECCKPSVIVKKENVYVMFRNWLNGNRDLYLIQSHDNGISFGPAEKLGTKSWALNGCPMDGGGIAVSSNNTIQTVWRRENAIFAYEPGSQEILLGEGRSCVIETVGNKNVYAWTLKGEVICALPNNKTINLGKGSLPIIKEVNEKRVVCVWENDRQIEYSFIDL